MRPGVVILLVIIVLLVMGACSRPEPRFAPGDRVELKLLPIKARVLASRCVFSCDYYVRLQGDGSVWLLGEAEMEPAS